MRFLLIRSSSVFLLYFLITTICSLLPQPCSSAHTLAQSRSITGNQTLVSDGDMFEFGFFTLGNRTDRRHYLGIWYYNITPQVVVWVANRDTPFANSSGIVSVSFDGLLAVRDGASNVWWSTDASSSAAGNYSATIQQDGNLVVGGTSSSEKLWQSFEHPTDTFLPGMTLRRNKTARSALRPWKSPDDPSVGNYSLFLDPRGMYQILTVVNSSSSDLPNIWWRSGPWTSGSKTFNGVTRIRPMGIFGFSLYPNLDGAGNVESIDFKFDYSNNSTRIRFVLLPNGTETTYIYGGGQWKFNWSQPAEECQEYNKCGHNTMCREDTNPKCSCLGGFKPRSEAEWATGNRSGGCVRRTQLPCGGVGFNSLDHMKLPDVATLSTDSSVSNESNCRSFCLNNCSCTAYAFAQSEGCFTWGGDLIDILQFTDGINGEFLKIKLPISELSQLSPAPAPVAEGEGGNNREVVVAIVVPVVAAGVIFLLICLCLCWKYKSNVKEVWKKGRTEVAGVDILTSGEQRDHPTELCDERQSEGEGPELPLFSFDVIQSATSNFSQSNTLGKGGFGHVYMGILPGGERVAVKRLSQNSCQGLEEFKNEMTLIAKLQHNNLVRLQGCCIQGYEKMLLYEYMPNMSLDAFIFDPTRQPLLDWRKRFNIIEGVARGLLYLHRDSRLRIVHRDLKASNVLLDEEMNPKISDFGMARIFGGNQNQDNTNRVVGTFGYMSPEYAMEGLFSVKSDVYSFGVLVLEIVSGSKNNRVRSDNFPNLLGYAWQLWKQDKTIDLVDPSVYNTCSSEEVLRCIHIALLCVQDRPKERPTISQIIIMLGSETRIRTIPKEPTFAAAAAANPSGTTTRYNDDMYSTNDVTITTITGR